VSDYLLLLASDPDSAVDLRALLEREGYRVRVAVSEPQALALAHARLPLVALVDVDSLAESEADEQFWIGELKRRYGRRPFPIILISERPDLAERADRLFADGWLPKPVDPGGLILLVKRTAWQAPATLDA
jgi:CheY-like chemotaxis protein